MHPHQHRMGHVLGICRCVDAHRQPVAVRSDYRLILHMDVADLTLEAPVQQQFLKLAITWSRQHCVDRLHLWGARNLS